MTSHIPYLFLGKDELLSEKFSDEHFKHLIQVLRMNSGEIFFASDNSGNYYECRLVEVSKKNAIFAIEKKEFISMKNLSVNLIQGITKTETFEEILDKSVQLGVTCIYPVVTKYSSVSKDLYNKKYERFQKIIKSSAEQSRRLFLPELMKINDIDFIISNFSPEKTIIAYEKSETSLNRVMKNIKFSDSVSVFFGPEGGFSHEEIEKLTQNKFKNFNLGKNILRSETAVIAGISNIFYEINNLPD